MNDYEKDHHEGHREHEGKTTPPSNFNSSSSGSTTPSGETSIPFQASQNENCDWRIKKSCLFGYLLFLMIAGLAGF